MTVRVLVTRPPGTWPALAAQFSGTEVVLEFAPTTTQVDALDRSAGDEALNLLPSCDWLVVTSVRGVEALSRRLAARGFDVLPRGVRVGAVGPATAAALAALGARAEVVAEKAGSDALAAALAPRVGVGTRVLLVRPEGLDSPLAASLRAAGARVEEAPLYRTVPSTEAAGLVARALSGAFAAVVFTAPSSLELWLGAAGERRALLAAALGRVRRVAIGSTTAAGLAAARLPADEVADAPSEHAVGDAIVRALARST